MTTAIVSGAEVVRSLLDTNWNATNSEKPCIRKTGDPTMPREDLMMAGGSIRIYNLQSDESIYALNYTHTRLFATVSVDVSYPRGETKFYQMTNEVRRLLHYYRKIPGNGWDEMLVLRQNDQTNKHTSVFRIIFDVELRRWGETI